MPSIDLADPPVPRFRRDAFTWAAYGMFACYACLQVVLGTVMPQLLQELSYSDRMGGLHMSAFALGMVAAGLQGERWTRVLRVGPAVLGGSVAMAMGALLFCLGRVPPLTLAGMLIMGLCGTVVLLNLQASLSRRHGHLRTVALAEATIGASLAAACLPLLVSLCEGQGWGWRTVVEAVLVAWALLWLTLGRAFVEGLRDGAESPTGEPIPRAVSGLPRAFWAWWLAILTCQGIEWCMVLWGAVFFQRYVGFRPANASGIMSVLFVSAVIGRWAGSRLALRFDAARLYFVALGVGAAGFPLFWKGPGVPGHVAGLFLFGLGVSNLFPMGLSLALGVAPERADQISARVLLGAGLAILVAPLVLGGLADLLTLDRAFAVILLLVPAAAAQGAWALREQRGRS